MAGGLIPYTEERGKPEAFDNDNAWLNGFLSTTLEVKDKSQFIVLGPKKPARVRTSTRSYSEDVDELQAELHDVATQVVDWFDTKSDKNTRSGNVIELIRKQQDGWGALAAKNKAVFVHSPFYVAEDMAQLFLSDGFKEPVGGDCAWDSLYVCAFVCSRLGEGDRAVVMVDATDLRDKRYREARARLIKSGQIESVVFPFYARSYIRYGGRAARSGMLEGKAFIVLRGKAAEDGDIVFSETIFSRAKRREVVTGDARRSEPVAMFAQDLKLGVSPAADLIADEARLDYGQAWRRKLAGSWGETLQTRFEVELVPSFSLYNYEQMRNTDEKREIETRVLSPSDFGLEDEAVPWSDNARHASRHDVDSQVISSVKITEEMRSLRGLQVGDILVSRLGRGKKPYVITGFETGDKFDVCVAGDNFFVLRPANPEDSDLIVSVLRGAMARWQLSVQSSGPRAVLTGSDLLNIVIPDIDQDCEETDDIRRTSAEVAKAHAEMQKAVQAYSAQRTKLVKMMRNIEKSQGFW